MAKPKIIIFCSDDKRFPAIEYVKALIEEFEIIAWIDKKPHKKFLSYCRSHKINYFSEYQIDRILSLIQTENIIFGIVISFNKILPAKLIAAFKIGLLNCHPSDLPLWRGGSPVESAIISGLKELVITAMLLNLEMDSGPIVAKQRIDIKEHSLINAIDCYQAISKNAKWFAFTAKQYYLGDTSKLLEQDSTRASYTQSLPTTRINFLQLLNTSERKLINLINAYCISPKVYLELNKKLFNLIKISPILIRLENPPIKGKLYLDDSNRLLLGLGDNYAEVLEIQPESRNILSSRDFINGYAEVLQNILAK